MFGDHSTIRKTSKTLRVTAPWSTISWQDFLFSRAEKEKGHMQKNRSWKKQRKGRSRGKGAEEGTGARRTAPQRLKGKRREEELRNK